MLSHLMSQYNLFDNVQPMQYLTDVVVMYIMIFVTLKNLILIQKIIFIQQMQNYQKSLYKKNQKQQQKPKKRDALNQIQKHDILKKHHKFIRQSSSQQQEQKNQKKQKPLTPQQKLINLSKNLYSSLYKQYALVDLSQYQSGKIGCRWRTQKQVIKGKGERICAELKCKNQKQSVFQMNFKYQQHGQRKNALVKVGVCHQCSIKLNFKKKLLQVQVKIQEN